MSMSRTTRRQFIAASAAVLASRPAIGAAPDGQELEAVIEKGYGYLKSKQKEDGSFAPPQVGEPGISSLVVAGLIRCGKLKTDPVVANALKYIEGTVKSDGGVYVSGFANYTTSLAVMAMKDANTDKKYDAAIAAATKFLRTLQYGEGDDITEKDPKYGGAGYGQKGQRGGADLSNTHFFLEALTAGGAGKDDPSIKRALTFLSRVQNLPGEFNDMEYAKKAGEDDKGGFIYNPAEVGNPNSRKKSATGGLRSEGGMTYSGLKSFLYAGVSKDDYRVKAAIAWVRKHYTLKENPGMGQSGLYYYYHVFAKAMDALGEDPFVDAEGVKHDWRKELFDTLKSKQAADGHWVNGNRDFGENLPELATAFALLALGYCKANK